MQVIRNDWSNSFQKIFNGARTSLTCVHSSVSGLKTFKRVDWNHRPPTHLPPALPSTPKKVGTHVDIIVKNTYIYSYGTATHSGNAAHEFKKNWSAKLACAIRFGKYVLTFRASWLQTVHRIKYMPDRLVPLPPLSCMSVHDLVSVGIGLLFGDCGQVSRDNWTAFSWRMLRICCLIASNAVLVKWRSVTFDEFATELWFSTKDWLFSPYFLSAKRAEITLIISTLIPVFSQADPCYGSRFI